MTAISFFQNHECIIPFDKVSHVSKHPPDRLEVVMIGGETFTVLGDDCKIFLQWFIAHLNAQAKITMASVPQRAPAS